MKICSFFCPTSYNSLPSSFQQLLSYKSEGSTVRASSACSNDCQCGKGHKCVFSPTCPYSLSCNLVAGHTYIAILIQSEARRHSWRLSQGRHFMTKAGRAPAPAPLAHGYDTDDDNAALYGSIITQVTARADGTGQRPPHGFAHGRAHPCPPAPSFGDQLKQMFCCFTPERGGYVKADSVGARYPSPSGHMLIGTLMLEASSVPMPRYKLWPCNPQCAYWTQMNCVVRAP